MAMRFMAFCIEIKAYNRANPLKKSRVLPYEINAEKAVLPKESSKVFSTSTWIKSFCERKKRKTEHNSLNYKV